MKILKTLAVGFLLSAGLLHVAHATYAPLTLGTGANNAAAGNDKRFTTHAPNWTYLCSAANPLINGTDGTFPMLRTYMVECNPAFQANFVEAVYGNYTNNSVIPYSGQPNTNQIHVHAELQCTVGGVLTVDSRPFTFGGRSTVTINGVQIVTSDPLANTVFAGVPCYIRTTPDTNFPAGPAAPGATAVASGGFLGANTYNVAQTYVFADGTESATSACTAVTVVANGSITITAPTAVAGASGYNTYASSSSTAWQYRNIMGFKPFSAGGTITQIPSNASRVTSAPIVNCAATNPSIPLGSGVSGGSGQGGNGSLEGYVSGTVAPDSSIGISAAVSTVGYGPLAILGYNGTFNYGVDIAGDSIVCAQGDSAYGSYRGGIFERALTANTTTMKMNPNQKPLFGIAKTCMPGETAEIANTPYYYHVRDYLAAYATDVWSDYGTNSRGLGAAAAINGILSFAQKYTPRGVVFTQTTMLPVVNTSDGYQTLANQNIGNGTVEGYRRQMNNVILSTSAAQSITGETLFGGYASILPATNVYGGGNGTATTFLTKYPFVEGSEAFTVGGTAQTLTTNYTYLTPFTIGSTIYANGIVLTAAPANGVIVAGSYTSMAGLTKLDGTGLLTGFDDSSAVEVNGSGVAGINGGFIGLPLGGTPVTGSPTTSTTAVLTDTTQSLTVDAYAGWAIDILTDTTTPAAVNQTRCVLSNSANAFTLAEVWTTAPSTAATYKVYQGLFESIHPCGYGAMAISVPLSAAAPSLVH